MEEQVKITLGHYTSGGRKARNQDFIGARVPVEPALLARKGVVAAIADGISSSDVSQVASELAVGNFIEDYYCTSETWTVANSARTVLRAINSWLYSQSQRGPHHFDKNRGYVCTFSGVVIQHRAAYLFHIGDSRIYRQNATGLEQLTNDHRVWVNAHESYLSRALGTDEDCALDERIVPLHQGDLLLLATDGIYEFVDQAVIATALAQAADLDQAASGIAECALARGSDDNLSILLLRIDQLPSAVEAPVREQMRRLPLPPALAPRGEIDGYRILRELHSSARSHVYLVEDTATGKLAALKTLATELAANEQALERFLLEEWIARRLNHPNVLRPMSAESPRRSLYTLFEYIEGQTLAQWALDNPRASLEAVRDIITQVAQGLHAFHRLEMRHQDLRPENLLIDRNGTVKIIDFGAVHVAGLTEAAVAPPVQLLGTALYSAPELFLGEAGSAQADVFALGVLTYFLLSGRYPYGPEVARCKTRAAQRRLRYRTVLHEEREIPAWVDAAIEKAVHIQPSRRYSELFEFIHDLRQPSRHFLNQSRPPLIERHPVAFWQAVSTLLALVVLGLLASR